MADLSSILTDPNYVNANPATKQAIFDKFSANDTNFTGANPATQDAIRVKFGLTASSGGIPVGRQTAPEQTMTQKVYQAIRPYAAPLIEGAGAIGGGVLGATAGTFGAGPVGTALGGVAGAGLGYGAGKELMNIGDVYIGGQPQRAGAAQVTEPLKNIAEGATMEVGGQLAGKALGYVAGKVADLRQIPVQKAATIARNALGPDLPVVLNALKTAPEQGITAAQATADINSPTWQALLDRAVKRDPRFLEALKTSQGDVSVNALAKLAGGATAAETRAATEAAKGNLNVVTTPMREAALNRANLGKAVADYEAQAGKLSEDAAAKVADVRRLMNAGDLAEASARLDLIKQGRPVGATKYTYKGELGKMADDWATGAANASLDLGQGARFAQGAADAMRSAGIKPLEGEPLVRSIQAVTRNTEFAGNDIMNASVTNLARDISQWTGSGGVIDAKALDAIRKNSVNAAVRDLLKGQSPDVQRQAAAGAMSKLKPLIDDAIEAAGGEGYKQYLSDYSKGMQRISEQKLTGEALNLWKTNKDAFVKLVQNESPDAVEKILGPGKYNIAKEVSDNTLNTLQDQASKAVRDVKVSGQVTAGQDALKELLLDQISKFRIPSYLSAVAATTNKALSILENKIGQGTMNALTEASKTPGGAAKLIETLPGSERNRVIQLLSNPQQWKPGAAATTGAAATNMLAPESQNQNALAK